MNLLREDWGPLLEFFDSLLKVESSAGLEDVLLHCCRGFIPLEHLLRTYQPYEIHLLVQALNWERSFLVDDKPAPISLGFAAIAGSVPDENLSDSESSRDASAAFDQWLVPYRSLLSLLSNDSESSRDASAAFDQWLVPYRSLFSALSADFALPAVQDASKQIGKQGQQELFAHQTSGLLNTIWRDPIRKKLSYRSEYALWLAKTQATELWGSLHFDVDEKISTAFPRWDNTKSSAKDVVNMVVDLGLWGGLERAAEPPKEKDIDRKWYEAKQLSDDTWKLIRSDSEEDIKETIKYVRDSFLSVSVLFPSDTSLPDWVTTKAFAICFYHGVRQAAYHALKAFYRNGKKKGSSYLWIKWDAESVSIYNRGEFKKLNRPPKDRGFFDLFIKKTVRQKDGKRYMK